MNVYCLMTSDLLYLGLFNSALITNDIQLSGFSTYYYYVLSIIIFRQYVGVHKQLFGGKFERKPANNNLKIRILSYCLQRYNIEADFFSLSFVFLFSLRVSLLLCSTIIYFRGMSYRLDGFRLCLFLL